jgi:hypothetical protein
MRVLYVLLAVIQFSFAFHAMKTGRGAMMDHDHRRLPVIGCLAYYFLEVFPHSREERAVAQARAVTSRKRWTRTASSSAARGARADRERREQGEAGR